MSAGWLRAINGDPLLREGIELVGLVDIDEARARQRAQEFALGAIAISTDLDAFLAEQRPELLFDVAPPPARFEIVASGLKHACHVLSEKPMAVSLAQARDLIGLAAKAGRVHAVVQNRRYIPGVRRIRRFLASGALGNLTALHADFFIGAHFGGFRDEMENPLLLDMAIHTFDAARFMANEAPLAVYCHETNPSGSWYRHGAAASAIFELSRGVVFTYRGSWCAEGANTSWESAWRIVGDKGTLLWDGAESFEARVISGADGFLRENKPVDIPDAPDAAQTRGHASVIADFIAGVEAGRAPETAAPDNIKSLAMALAAIESARSHQRVEISP
jgi:predicted dehydrogenase